MGIKEDLARITKVVTRLFNVTAVVCIVFAIVFVFKRDYLDALMLVFSGIFGIYLGKGFLWIVHSILNKD